MSKEKIILKKKLKKQKKAWDKIIKNNKYDDYDYLLIIIRHQLEIMFTYFLLEDKKDKRIESSLSEIKKVLDLFEELEEPFISDLNPLFYKKIKEIFSIISNNIKNWWV